MELLKEGHLLQDGPFWVYTSYEYKAPNFEVVTFCGDGPEKNLYTCDELGLLKWLVNIDSENIEKFIKDPSWGCQCVNCDKRRRALEAREKFGMMKLLREKALPMKPEAFKKLLEDHNEFLQSGGAGGSWKTMSIGEGPKGMVIGVYTGAGGLRGKQATPFQTNLEGLPLVGVQLPYANLIGVMCRNQNLEGANFEGTVATDSDFSGSSFKNANLRKADFSRSILLNCDFTGADLTDADFENAEVTKGS